MSRRDVEPRARDRHGRGRPRDPGREPEVGRARPAAGRPCGPRARLGLEGPPLPEVPRRPARVRRRRPRDARWRDRGDGDPAEPARRARPADRGDRGRGRRRARRPPPARSRRLPVLRSLPRPARERARHARGPLPVGRVRRAAPADRLGPDGRSDPRAHGRAAARDHECGHDPGPRPLRRPPRRRRRPGRRARRGDGLRGAAGSDVHARRLDLADRGDHARPRARLAGAGRAGRDSLLEGRGRRAPVRARREDRRRQPRARGALRRQGRQAAAGGLLPRSARRARTCSPISASRPPRPGRSPPTGRSWSSASATRSATGASAS